MKINQLKHLPKIPSKEKVANSPFSIPQDAEIFRNKEKQKDRKRQQRAENAKLKIWEKGTKKQGLTMKQINQLGNLKEHQEQNQAKMSLIEAAKSAIKNRVKVNQPMHQFISKKRQTLLFQMLIDHKREKINEFQDLTRLHRKGLQRAQQMLEEDMQAFNSYLNENKRQARDAIKKAQKQTRLKNQKAAVIKQKLQIQADLTGKNMSKRQALENLKKYKIFLESLSPQYTQQERKKKLQKIEKEQLDDPNVQNQDSLDQNSQIYFKEPQQLINIFHSLEQSNLFMITHLKEMEQQIEQTRGQLNKKKQDLTSKKNDLIFHKTDLTKQVRQIEQQIEQLKKKTNKDDISQYYKALEDEIIKMSREIGFFNIQKKHIEALELLKDIERKIQTHIRQIKQAKQQKPNQIAQLENDCFQFKRQSKKKKNQQQFQQKAKKQKQDSSPHRERRKGRPVMTRSIIKKQQRQKQVEVVEPQEEIQRRKYLM